jgi:hypothetical protein
LGFGGARGWVVECCLGLSVISTILINAKIGRTGSVEFKVVLLEVGMAEIALMFVQQCSLHSPVLQAHTSASTSTTTSYPCLFAML